MQARGGESRGQSRGEMAPEMAPFGRLAIMCSEVETCAFDRFWGFCFWMKDPVFSDDLVDIDSTSKSPRLQATSPSHSAGDFPSA